MDLNSPSRYNNNVSTPFIDNFILPFRTSELLFARTHGTNSTQRGVDSVVRQAQYIY